MRRLAALAALVVLVIAAGLPPAPADARSNPNCRAGTTLAVIGGKPQCLRARLRCRPKLDRQYRTYGYRCRKGKKRRGGKRRPARLKLGNAKARRYGDGVPITPGKGVDKPTALQAFAKTIGPLPGVKVKRGVVGTIRSGTGPWRWIQYHRSRLTARQRRAIDSYERALFPEVSSSGAADAQKVLDEEVAKISARVGEPLGRVARVTPAAGPGKPGDAYATAETFTEGGKPVCRVTLLPPGQAQAPDPQRDTMAHEAFHCFQMKWNASGYEPSTEWLWEGSANWAAHRLGQERGYTDADDRVWWMSWLQNPTPTLFSRSYAAMGFFAHMETSGLSFWGNIKSLIQKPSAAAAYAEATGASVTGPRLLNTWAPSYHRAAWAGLGWNFTGPSIPPTKPAVPKGPLTNGSTITMTSLERSAAVRRITLKSEVMTVSGGGYGRLVDYDKNERPLASGDYCTKPEGCTCPAGQPGPPDKLNAAILVGLTGHDEVATVRFKGRSLKDWCKKAPPGGRLTITGSLSGVATGVGTCRVGSDGEFMAIIETDTSPRRFLQMDTSRYAGPGSYAATGRGVTSGPRVWVTDGMGTEFGTDHRPEGAEGGSFTVSSETPTQMRGSVAANMYSSSGAGGASASGTWVCDKT